MMLRTGMKSESWSRQSSSQEWSFDDITFFESQVDRNGLKAWYVPSRRMYGRIRLFWMMTTFDLESLSLMSRPEDFSLLAL
eukprot:scaffold93559_cov49-Attheya_sp.AAC.1